MPHDLHILSHSDLRTKSGTGHRCRLLHINSYPRLNMFRARCTVHSQWYHRTRLANHQRRHNNDDMSFHLQCPKDTNSVHILYRTIRPRGGESYSYIDVRREYHRDGCKFHCDCTKQVHIYFHTELRILRVLHTRRIQTVLGNSRLRIHRNSCRTRSMRLHLEEHRLLPYGEWHPNYMCIGLHCLQPDKFHDRNNQILLLVNRKHCSLNMGHRTCRNCCHANCSHIPNISHRYCDQNIRIVLRNYILLLNYRLIHRNICTMATTILRLYRMYKHRCHRMCHVHYRLQNHRGIPIGMRHLYIFAGNRMLFQSQSLHCRYRYHSMVFPFLQLLDTVGYIFHRSNHLHIDIPVYYRTVDIRHDPSMSVSLGTLVHNRSCRRRTSPCRMYSLRFHMSRDHGRCCIYHQSFSLYCKRCYHFQN